MNKKTFWKLLTGLFLVANLTLLSACSDAEENVSKNATVAKPVVQEKTQPVNKTARVMESLQDIDGRYVKLPSPQATGTGDKIEVLEVFWYGCPHCYQFEPVIENWLREKAEYIEFVRMPGVMGKNWLPHARAYYAAKKLGVLDKIHRPLFNAMHKDKRKIMGEEDLKDFFSEQGVSAKDFEQAYQSKEVEELVREAYLVGQRYELTGVPAVIVDGKYGTSASMAGSYDKVMSVVNTLAAEEHKKRINK